MNNSIVPPSWCIKIHWSIESSEQHAYFLSSFAGFGMKLSQTRFIRRDFLMYFVISFCQARLKIKQKEYTWNMKSLFAIDVISKNSFAIISFFILIIRMNGVDFNKNKIWNIRTGLVLTGVHHHLIFLYCQTTNKLCIIILPR